MICRFHRYWAYSSKSTVWPKMESCFQDGACSFSFLLHSPLLMLLTHSMGITPRDILHPGSPTNNLGERHQPLGYKVHESEKKVKVKLLSHVRLVATPWTVAYQVPHSMGFSRQVYWSGLPFPSPTKFIIHCKMQGPQSRTIKATVTMVNIVFHQSSFT